MQQIDLVKMIEQRKIELENALTRKNKELAFFEQFENKYDIDTADGMVSIPKTALFAGLLLALSDKFTLDEITEFVQENVMFIEFITDKKAIEIFEILRMLRETVAYEEIKEIVNNPEKKLTVLDVFKKEVQVLVMLYKVLDEELGKDLYSLPLLLEFAEKDDVNIISIKTFFTILNGLKNVIDADKEWTEKYESENGTKIPEKTKTKIKRQNIENYYNINNIKKYIAAINKKHVKLASEDKKRKSKIQKEIAAYNELEEKLFAAMEKGEVTTVKKLISKIPDENIRLEVLKTVYVHNAKLYEALQKEYESLSASSASRYQVVLANNGISADKYDATTVMDKSIEELEQMIEKLKKMSITGPNLLLSILQSSTLDIINKVEQASEMACIANAFIVKHPQLFIPDSKELANMISNTNFFAEEGINVHYLRGNQEMVLLEPTKLKESINTLKEYELLGSMKTGIDCTFLQDENLAQSIDILLELGYEANLEDSLEILNYKDNFERLRLLKELNIPISSTEELISVLSSEKFLMPNEDISSYIYNAVNYKLPAVDKSPETSPNLDVLDEYSNTNRTYSFDGVLISKNKVKRNITTVAPETNQEDRLVYSATYGSILSDEEFAKIEGTIRKTSAKTMQKTSLSE